MKPSVIESPQDVDYPGGEVLGGGGVEQSQMGRCSGETVTQR